MTEKRKWRTLDSDMEFGALFVGATITEVSAYPDGLPYIGADLYWHLSDGRWLAMEVSTAQGCDTCGYGAGEKTYYLLEPSSPVPPKQ